MSNFWGRFFHVFGVKFFFKNIIENTIRSALKGCIIPFLQKKITKNFDPENMKNLGFFRAAQILKSEFTT